MYRDFACLQFPTLRICYMYFFEVLLVHYVFGIIGFDHSDNFGFGVTKFSITKLENMLHMRSHYKHLPRVNFLISAIGLCTYLYLRSNPF